MANNSKTSYILGGIGIFFSLGLLVVHTVTAVIASIGLSQNESISGLGEALARLALVPAYFAVFAVIASIAIGIVDLRRFAIGEPRRATSLATLGTGIVAFLCSGATFFIYLNQVPVIFIAPLTFATFLIVGSFIGIIVVTAVYMAFFCLWTSTLRNDPERMGYTERLHSHGPGGLGSHGQV